MYLFDLIVPQTVTFVFLKIDSKTTGQITLNNGLPTARWTDK